MVMLKSRLPIDPSLTLQAVIQVYHRAGHKKESSLNFYRNRKGPRLPILFS